MPDQQHQSGSSVNSKELQAALDAAEAAATVIRSLYQRNLAVHTKADASPVTEADVKAEEAIREILTQRFPAYGFYGEETGQQAMDAENLWLVDPIDGTKSFVRGTPLWGSLVALCEGTRVLAGAAYFPAVDELLAAAPGAGCWWNGRRCHVSDVGVIGEATVLTTDERFRERPDRLDGWRELASAAAVSRTWGDCFGYLLVATGRAEVMCDPVLSPWDAAALQPIIEEAGGSFTDWEGASTAFGGSAIATNRRLASEVRRVLAPGASSSTLP